VTQNPKQLSNPGSDQFKCQLQSITFLSNTLNRLAVAVKNGCDRNAMKQLLYYSVTVTLASRKANKTTFAQQNHMISRVRHTTGHEKAGLRDPPNFGTVLC
jgi:hypothetical protein